MIFREEIESMGASRLRVRDARDLPFALGLFLLLGPGAEEVRAQDGHTLRVLPGPFGSDAASINKKGQIVGGLFGEAGTLPAFWAGPDSNAPTILPVPSGDPGPFGGFASSINKKGQIVGQLGGLPAF